MLPVTTVQVRASGSAATAGCSRLARPTPEAIALARKETEQKRTHMQAEIRRLHPGICANVAPLLFLLTFWLCWTVGVPVGLLLTVRSDGDVTNADPMRIIGWTFLGTGLAYLVAHILPIVTLGGCCMPGAPDPNGPLLKRPLRRVGVNEGEAGQAQKNSTLLPQSPAPYNIAGRCVYILLNNHGIHGPKATQMAAACTLALNRKSCCVHKIETQYAGHMCDLGRDPDLLPLSNVDGVGVGAVLIVGGDGSFSEFVNGYLQRCERLDIPPEARTPLALIPAGSGNSLARDVYGGPLDIDSVLSTVLTGAVVRMDVSEIQDQAGLKMISTNVISFGLVGDTAVVAEDYRMLGDLRYDIVAVWFVMRRVTSSARFILRGLGGAFNARRGNLLDFGPSTTTPAAASATPVSPSPPATTPSSPHVGPPFTDADAPFSRDSIELYGRKTTAFFNQTSHFGKGLRACPHSLLDDGLIDVVFGESASRTSLLTMFQQLPKGAHLGNKAVSHFQVEEITLNKWSDEQSNLFDKTGSIDPNQVTPPQLSSNQIGSFVINVDGENVVVTGEITIRARLRQIPIFVPTYHGNRLA